MRSLGETVSTAFPKSSKNNQNRFGRFKRESEKYRQRVQTIKRNGTLRGKPGKNEDQSSPYLKIVKDTKIWKSKIYS